MKFMKFILQAKNLKKSFYLDKRKIDILKNLTVEIEKGEFVAIMGQSGSGKTTLLSILAGLDIPDSGSIILDGTEISKSSEDNLAQIRNEKIGFIFQSFYLIPSLSAIENILFPLEVKQSKRENITKARELMKKVGLGHRENSMINQLSGGERQRVAICRSLINDPQIIFADEPTGNLDSKNSNEILKILLDLKKEFNTTLVIVTHEESIAKKANRIIRIIDGTVK